MNIDTIPLFSMLRSRLGYLTQREGLISQNVANASTPNYAPRDLDGFSFSGAMAASEGGGGAGGLDAGPAADGHIALQPAKPGGAWKAQVMPDSEVTLDGNQVVLEDQMMKMNEARMDYDAAVGFYQKSLNMIQMAIRKPGS
jgi:flagellar basal-body rod protein FlgB